MKQLRFSQRIGVSPIRDVIQIESIDEVLNTRLWNWFIDEVLQEIGPHSTSTDRSTISVQQKITRRTSFLGAIWTEFFCKRSNTLPGRSGSPLEQYKAFIETFFFNPAIWAQKYDLIEFINRYVQAHYNYNGAESLNRILEEEMAGYRLIEGFITPITSEAEIKSIEEAIENHNEDPVGIHLTAAIQLFSDRKAANYRNSIKESISAVESMCQQLSGKKKATLTDGLKEIEKKHKLHKALKDGFGKIYGYTNDSGGIRHAMDDEGAVTFEDAKFMLVACSAFINYLRGKFSKPDMRN